MVVKGSLDIFMEVWNKIIGAYRKNGTQVPQRTQDPGPYEDPGLYEDPGPWEDPRP